MPSSWRLRLESLPWTPPADPGGSVLVLSAHPDDEVLAIGGWLAGQTRRDVTFVTATDGEASHPASPTTTPDDLRARRPGELIGALELLGFERPVVHRLELPDGGLTDSADRLDASLARLVERADLVLAPFEADGHPDHDAVGAAAVRLCADTTPLWRFPLWTWAWTEPDDQPWAPQMRRLDCSSAARVRKRRAIAAFETQVNPLSDDPSDAAVVDGVLLRHALYAPEVVLV
jgi:LmbE family N-acetylglucosaminyl deacetylase